MMQMPTTKTGTVVPSRGRERGADEDAAAADAVGQGAAGAGDDEGRDRDQAHEHSGGVEADVPHLGEIDDRERPCHWLTTPRLLISLAPHGSLLAPA
jgi:hypothetical protein